MSGLESVYLGDNDGWGDGRQVLLCPTCQYDYMHRAGVDLLAAGEFRQGGAALHFIGECGHAFDLVIGEHKGKVYLAVQERPDRDDPHGATTGAD